MSVAFNPSTSQPVVPQTTGTPCARAARMFRSAASGRLNSIATSALRNAGLSKVCGEVNGSMIQTISCPRERATDSIIRPILPYPIRAIFIMLMHYASVREYTCAHKKPTKIIKKMHICKLSRRKIACMCIFSVVVLVCACTKAVATVLKIHPPCRIRYLVCAVCQQCPGTLKRLVDIRADIFGIHLLLYAVGLQLVQHMSLHA